MTTTIKVPQEVQVGGHVYVIELDGEDLKDSHNWGETNFRTLTIKIDKERGLSQRQETLLHELIHVIDEVYMHCRLTEDQVDALGQGLNQIFFDFGIVLDWSEVKGVVGN